MSAFFNGNVNFIDNINNNNFNNYKNNNNKKKRNNEGLLFIIQNLGAKYLHGSADEYFENIK
jgi:hypothetical protein